jgi:hypothetical protein
MPASRVLACVYTCEQHRHLLERFHESEPGRLLASSPDIRVIEVYADPTVAMSRVRGDELRLRGEERYDALSVKTHRMLEFCVQNFQFRNLLKIDVTTVMTRMDGPTYAGRQPIDQAALARFIREADYGEDYTGFLQHAAADRNGAEGWATKKGGVIDYPRLFGDGPIPPFFSGKCYILSHRFATYVANRGADLAEEQRRYFLGSEDVLVGRLFEKYVAEGSA